MCVCVYIYTHYICECKYTICKYMYSICICVYLYVSIYVYNLYTYIHTYIYIHIYIYIYICVYKALSFKHSFVLQIFLEYLLWGQSIESVLFLIHVCVYTYMYMNIYIYIYTPNVLVIYQCVTAYPKTQWLKAKGVHYHRISTGQVSWGGLGGCFWLQISHEAAVKLSSRNASPLKAQTGLENFFQTHSRGCGQTTVPSHVGCLPGGYVSRIMGTGDQREKERDQGGNHHLFIT